MLLALGDMEGMTKGQQIDMWLELPIANWVLSVPQRHKFGQDQQQPIRWRWYIQNQAHQEQGAQTSCRSRWPITVAPAPLPQLMTKDGRMKQREKPKLGLQMGQVVRGCKLKTDCAAAAFRDGLER